MSRPSSSVFVFLGAVEPEVVVYADTNAVCLGLESIDAKRAAGFTDTGRRIRITPTDDIYCNAELTEESDPAKLHELLATARVPADLAALADDPPRLRRILAGPR